MFQPILPSGGLSGWAFLQRTFDSQTEAFNQSATLRRDTDYFEAEIGKITSAEDLVSDRRLLRVALGAFGLQDDIDNRFFIRKVLEEGTTDDDALANRLSDDRYQKLAEAFAFDSVAGPRTLDPGFAPEINALFRSREFEVAVGNQDEAMRLALNAQRALVEIADRDEAETTKWFRILGTPPLREVFERALGLPEGFGQLDIDKQVEIFQSKAQSNLGVSSLSDFADAKMREDLTRTYLLRDQLTNVSIQSSGSLALTLLQSAQPLNRI